MAAAATAACLFSSSLGFQGNGDSNAPTLRDPAPNVTNPDCWSGGEGFSNLPGFGLDSPAGPTQPIPLLAQPQKSRERIRTVWESFRERLGLNRNSSAKSNQDVLPSSEEQGNLRPGEIMLAEMARALNIRIGLLRLGRLQITTS